MEIEVDGILRQAGQDGSMDYAAWPTVLPVVISRIEKIARQEFPIPNIPPPAPRVRPPSPRFLAPLPSSDPIEVTEPASSHEQETNKENTIPARSSSPSVTDPNVASSEPASAPNAPRERAQTPSPQSRHDTDGALDGAFPQDEPVPPAPNHLPAPLANMLEEITSTLGTFKRHPPHTLQRLAELVLCPRQHYRSLPAYLLALDRVVHVTSSAHIYPLPPAVPDMSALSVLANGGTRLSINSSTIAATIGSDEALGGALLTPIPWLVRRANGSEEGSEIGGNSPLSGSPSSAGASQNQMSQQHQHSHQQQIRQRSPTGTPAGPTGPTGRALDAQLRTESTETIDGPNGVGSIETVSISINYAQRGSVTQGELLRQEQRLGVVPVSQLARGAGGSNGYAASGPATVSAATSTTTDGSSAAAEPAAGAGAGDDGDVAMADESNAKTDGDGDEVPHARGPAEIGAVDLGPQSETTSTLTVKPDGAVDVQLDVEAATGQSPCPAAAEQTAAAGDSGSAPVPQSPKREAEDRLDAEAKASKRARAGEDDGDGDDENGPATNGAEAGASEAESKPADADTDTETETDAEGDIVLGDGEAATVEVSGPREDARAEERSGNADDEDGGATREKKAEAGSQAEKGGADVQCTRRPAVGRP